MNKIDLNVINVNNISQSEVLNEINKTLLKSESPKVLVTPNAGHLSQIYNDSLLQNIQVGWQGIVNFTFKVAP